MTHRFIAPVRTAERQRAGLTGLWRAGRFWPDAGTVVAAADLDDATWQRLMAEPRLDIRAATAEEVAAASGADDMAFAEVIDELMRVIPRLAAGDFTQDGQPRLKPLRKVAGIEDALITNEARDEAMRRLVEGGFKAPTEEG